MKCIYLNHKQSGVALIIGLIFLLIMSVAGLSSMGKVTLQERISGNTIDNNRAFQAAEIALAAAERMTLDARFTDDKYLVIDLDAYGWDALDSAELLEPSNWDCDKSSLQDGSRTNEKKMCTAQPDFKDSSISFTPQVKYERVAEDRYIITVKVAGNGRSDVMLQSIYDLK